MKRIAITLLIGALIWVSCKKENQAGTDPHLVGQWKWKSYQVGAPSNTLTPQNTGIQENLIFNSDLTWTKTQNGAVVRSGIYQTSITKSNTGESVNTLHYNNAKNGSDTTEYYIIQSDTTLTFSHDLIGTYGSAARTYVKSK